MRYVWCDDHDTFEQKGEDCPGKKASESRLMVFGDIEAFVSPVDGKVVTGRAALRDHNKRHGVTNVADFKNEWATAYQKRADFYQGKQGREERVQAIAQALEKHRGRS
jgi:hypothetical protein